MFYVLFFLFYRTQKEFDAVSSIVKGRVKLADLNEMYRQLFDIAQKYPDTPLAIKLLCDEGVKAVGLTAQCKLNTLRSLRIITLHRETVSFPPPSSPVHRSVRNNH